MSNSRRDFLTTAGRVAIALPAGFVFANLAGCGSDDKNDNGSTDTTTNYSGGGTCNNADKVGTSGTSLVVTSSCAGHTHDIAIADDVIAAPSGPLSTTSTSVQGHSHTVSLTEAQLQQIENGETVTVTSSAVGHTHDFSIRKAA